MAAHAGVPVMSLFDAVAARVRARETLYFPNDMHFNGAGLRLIADEVVGWIRRDGGLAIGARLGNEPDPQRR
jgi:hypothetical protein